MSYSDSVRRAIAARYYARTLGGAPRALEYWRRLAAEAVRRDDARLAEKFALAATLAREVDNSLPGPRISEILGPETQAIGRY